MKKFLVKNSESGCRLDKVIAARFPDRSRSTWQELIKAGKVRVNSRHLPPKYILQLDDSVDYPDNDQKPPIFVDKEKIINLDIIFENESILVVNKPFGLITHPAHANTDDSVVHRILHYNQSIKNAVYDPSNTVSLLRPGIVHRLDRNTSGVLIIAKTKLAMSFLAKQIQEHKAKKLYLALLWGHLEQTEIEVNNFLGRDVNDRRRMAIVDQDKGREAETIFKIKHLLKMNKGDRATLVEAMPITGRTHQIRVHALSIGHPVLGDPVYTKNEAKKLSERLGLKRQFLHAHQLTIRIPCEEKPRTFIAPLPSDLSKVLLMFNKVE